MELFKNTKVYDWHEHVINKNGTDSLDEKRCDRLVEHGRLLHIDKMAVSLPTSTIVHPERITAINNVVAEAVKRHPGYLYGLCYVDPHHGGFAAAEIERCIKDMGFIGVKLYTQKTIDDPMQYPIIEKCIEWDVPILMHAFKYGEHRCLIGEENTSHAVHFTNAAKRYPEAVFILAHITVGDWHWQLKGVADCPNIFTDISGSAYDQNIVDAVVSVFGAERVLFASDGSFSASVGKVLGAEISDDDKRVILNSPRFAKYIERDRKTPAACKAVPAKRES
jgi:hypothetical protein